MIETFFTAIAVLLRIVSNPLGNVFQKRLTNNGNHPLLVNLLTYLLLSFAGLFIAAGVHRQGFSKQFWLYAVLGGMAGALGNAFLVKALQKGDLSVLGPINAYKSVVGMFAGIFLLGEFPNGWGLLGIALIVYGSYFVLDTAQERFSWSLLKKSEIRFRIWAMSLTAIEAIFIKKIILVSSAVIAFISWCWGGAFFSFLLLLVYRVNVRKEIKRISHPDVRNYLFLVICIGIMQATTNYAFTHLPVGYALSLFQLSIVVSVLLGHHIFNEQGLYKKLVGSAIMIGGSVIILLLK